MKNIIFILLIIPHFIFSQEIQDGFFHELDGVELLTRQGYEVNIEPNLIDNMGQVETDILILQQQSDEQFGMIKDLFSIVKDLQEENIKLKKTIGKYHSGSEVVELSEKEFLIKNATSAKYIANRYYKSSSGKNGYSTIEISKLFDVDSSGKEIEIAERIFEKIKSLR